MIDLMLQQLDYGLRTLTKDLKTPYPKTGPTGFQGQHLFILKKQPIKKQIIYTTCTISENTLKPVNVKSNPSSSNFYYCKQSLKQLLQLHHPHIQDFFVCLFVGDIYCFFMGSRGQVHHICFTLMLEHKSSNF